MKLKYIFAFTGLLSLSSCSEDLLFQQPTTALSDSSILESADQLRTVLMGAYDLTGHFHYHTIGQISQEVMGNDLTISNGNFNYPTYNWMVFAYMYQQYPLETDGWWSAYAQYMWPKAYMAVNQCNMIISNKDNLPAGSEEILAQAHGLRGWNYLNLYHLFCPSYVDKGENGQGLFLRTKPADVSKDDAPRANLKQSFELIINDLKYAQAHCKEAKALTDKYFINQKAATLLLARAYLCMGDYDNAQKEVEKLGSSFDGEDLMSKADYQSGFNSVNGEWLWGYQYTAQTGNMYGSIPSFYYVAKAKDEESVFGTPGYGTKVDYQYLTQNGIDYLVGYSTVRATASFRNLFQEGDCRKLFPFYIDEKDGYMIAKFTSNGSLGVADYPMCRMAEAYLIEAECLLKGSNKNPEKAKDILNALQKKRGGKVTEATEEDIWQERRRELYGEGFALQDLKRLQKPLERTGPDQWSDVKHLPANSPRMMFPIPTYELEYNKNASQEDQNEYWR